MVTKLASSTVSNSASLRKVLAAINATPPAGIAFVLDAQNKLCGVVTDGDFRRWLLEGCNLDDSLKDISLNQFVHATAGESLEEIISRTNDKIRIIPIVNDQFELVDYIQIDKRMHLPVAVPDLNQGNELKYLTDAFLSSLISSQGAYINRFEEEFAAYCGVREGVATANGTVAIHLALTALGVGKGDEVIVPDLTFAATINAVLHAGATPVIVDVNLDDWCISVEEIKKAITPKTKAVIAVHLYGQPCEIDAIKALCESHRLFLIEDAAEAHGAAYKGQKVGSFGDIATFSFFANKVITTGEGGMCITDSTELAERMRILRDHGMNKQKRYWHEEVGFNYRMTNMQAAIGCAQLERIEPIITYRNELEEAYKEQFEATNLFTFQKKLPDREKTVWLVSALYEQEDKTAFMKLMRSNGIDVRPFFYPLSAMPIYTPYSFSNINSHLLSAKGLSFPTHWSVEVGKVAKALRQFTES
ncbi:MAG: aminotransferase class I/II-fold pyridoxal phosphate-dependent enzyme [Thermonemataceae bacterium]